MDTVRTNAQLGTVQITTFQDMHQCVDKRIRLFMILLLEKGSTGSKKGLIRNQSGWTGEKD